MSSRKLNRVAVLALVSSLGVSSLSLAGAAPAHGHGGPAVEADLSLRAFVYNVIDFLGSLSVVKSDPPPPNYPPGCPPPGYGSREGSSGCPVGRPPGPPPGQ